MIKKILCVLCIMFVIGLTFTNVMASDKMFHFGTYSEIYKLSEESDIELPFINMFTKAATYDKAVKHSGVSFGETTIDINEKLEGMQVLLSSDLITIKGEVENTFIYANNVIIEGKISGDAIIIAPKVQILEGAIVERDIIILTENLEVKGNIKGNIIATVSNFANISGTINGDLRIIAKQLDLSNEIVEGDIYISSNTSLTNIQEKYPEAVVEPYKDENNKDTDWVGIITKGIVTVIIYTVICLFVTRKENNIAEKAYKKFKEHTMFGLIIAIISLLLMLILPIILIIMGIVGLGVISWPILIAYAGIILFIISTAMLIVGMVIFESINSKVGKFKTLSIALIFAVLYTLTKIAFLKSYVSLSILVIAIAIVSTMIIKKQSNNNVKNI